MEHNLYKGMFGRNHKEIEGNIISRLGYPKKYCSGISLKKEFPWVSIQKEDTALDMIILVQEPNPDVFGEEGLLRNFILQYLSNPNSSITLAVESDPNNILETFPNISTYVGNLKDNFKSRPFRECVWAQHNFKDLVALYDPRENRTLFFWNNSDIHKDIYGYLKPLVNHIASLS